MAIEYRSTKQVDASKVYLDLCEVRKRIHCAQFALEYGSEEGGEVAEAVLEEVYQCLAILIQEMDEVSTKACNSVLLLDNVIDKLRKHGPAVGDVLSKNPTAQLEVLVNALLDEALKKGRVSFDNAKNRYLALCAQTGKAAQKENR